MTRDTFFKYYCAPLLVFSVCAMAVIPIINLNGLLIYSPLVLYLASYIPWLAVDIFDILEWER